MNIILNKEVPTGNILVVEGEHGKLECLSIGDYGKDVNLKADFMGLQREPSPVRHTKLLPLEEKWVITISTQYGCSMGCSFCDVPKVGPGVNATFWDFVSQVTASLNLHPEIESCERVNLHYARMGEPTWNPDVIRSAHYFAGMFKQLGFGFHPVVSTMMPRNNSDLLPFLQEWMQFKNEVMGGEAGLQLSINSTSGRCRETMFRGNTHSLGVIADIVGQLPPPKGRKITLNFALGDWPIDAEVLRSLFNPKHFLCKLTSLHQTRSVNSKNLMPEGDWTEYTPYADTERALKAYGFDVIVFIASKEEDESKITCGNAILSERK